MAAQRSLRYCQACGARLARDNRSTKCTTCQRNASELVHGPPTLRADFWTSAVIAEALHSWHIGRVIRAYRHHPLHGPRPLSQELVASWLGLTQTQLSRIEGGPPIKDLGKLVAWVRALDIPANLLWFKLPDASATITPPSSPSPRVVRANTDEHAARSVLSGFQDFDGSIVDYLTERLRSSKADDGTFGPARVLPTVLGIVEAIAEHVGDVKSAERERLLTLGAEGAEFAGWLYRDLRDPTAATYWYDRAMEWAQAANDTAMQGYVLLKKSQMAYEERDARRVAMLAEAAQHGRWQLPSNVRAEVTQQEARGLAMLGEPLAIVERKLDQAKQLFMSVEQADRLQFGSYFDAGALLLREASCYIEAGKPGRAAALFDDAITVGRLSRRDEGYFRARRAFACALSGEPDAAAGEGLTALPIAAAVNSERTTRELRRTVKALTPWESRPGPRQLREALRA